MLGDGGRSRTRLGRDPRRGQRTERGTGRASTSKPETLRSERDGRERGNGDRASEFDLITLDDDDDDRRIGLPAATRGAAVSRIDETSPLASALRPRDVITTLGGQPIRSAADLAASLKLRDSRTTLELGVRRLADGAWQRFNVRVP